MTVREALKKYPLREGEERSKWYARVAQVIGSTPRYVAKVVHDESRRKMVEPQPTDFSARATMESARVVRERAMERQRLKVLAEEFEHTEKRLELFQYMNQHQPQIEISSPPQGKKSMSTVIPVALWSDWHVEQRVDPATIHRLNEYNPEIAKDRVTYMVNNMVKLLQHQSSFVYFDTLCIMVNGDIINGYIHEEFLEDNFMSPTQAILYASDILRSALLFVAENSPTTVKKIIVICNYGNHGRTGKEKKQATGYKNSYEWAMYNFLANDLSRHSIFEFHVPSSLIHHHEFEFKGRKFVTRTWHGDNIKFQGGIGGITVPLNKFILRADQNIRADYNFMGHFHTLHDATKNAVVNGSVVGYDTYAYNLGLPYEPPMQSLKLIDLDRMMITTSHKILCQNMRK